MQRRAHHNGRQLMAYPAHKPFRIPRGEYYIKSEIVLLAYILSYNLHYTHIILLLFLLFTGTHCIMLINFSFFPGVHYAISHTMIIHDVSILCSY